MSVGKTKIIGHHTKSIEFVRALNNISEDQWRTKVGEDKWTVAEVIGHLIPWDEFVLRNRIPYLFTDDNLPKGPEAGTTNEKSATKAREREKKVTIESFISVRTELTKAIDEIPSACWEKELAIGQNRLSLYKYFEGLAKHDVHHFEQVKSVIQH